MSLSRRSFLGLAGAAACVRRGALAAPPAAGGVPVALVDFDAELERAMGAHSLAEWHAYTQEGVAPAGGLAALHADEQALFARARPVAARVLAAAAEGSAAHRAATLWIRGAQGLALVGDPETSRLAHELEEQLNQQALRPGERTLTRAELWRMAGDPDPGTRRAAMETQALAHRAVRDLAVALLRRRHAVARAHGLASWGDAMLRLRGIDPARWDALDHELETGTREPYRQRLAAGARARGLGPVMPWDLTWTLAEDLSWTEPLLPASGALVRAQALLEASGFDLARPPVRVLVREFAFGGQTLSIRVPDDVRTVLRPHAGYRFQRTLLHELGHAMQATRTRCPEAIFKGYEWVPGLSSPGFDEGMAETFARVLEDADVLARFTPLTAAQRTDLVAAARRDAVVSLRGLLAEVAFERAALADPTQDLDALWRATEHRYKLIEYPDDTPATWAHTPFLATYPVYRQSYVLAAAISAQVHAALRARFAGPWFTPEVARFMAENLFAEGESRPWEERLTRATGRPLDAQDLLAWLSG